MNPNDLQIEPEVIAENTARADQNVASGAELAAVLEVAEDGLVIIQTNKGAIRLEEFTLFGVSQASLILAEAKGLKGALAWLGGQGTTNPEVLSGLLESGDTLLKLVALSAGYLTRDNMHTDEWRAPLEGIKARHFKPLAEGVYQVNQFFFEELFKAFDLSLTRIANVVLQTLLGVVERLTNGMTPAPENVPDALTSVADKASFQEPVISDGEILLADLKRKVGVGAP